MKWTIGGAALLFTLTTAGGHAADLSFKDAPVANVEYSGSWTAAGDIFVRVRGLAVLPDAGSSDWRVNGGPLGASADVSISNTAVPEIDFTYFFTKNISAELIAAVTPHSVQGQQFIRQFGSVGDVWLLPPTLLLQYHFDTGTKFKPYAGVGLNYTVFFGESDGRNYSHFKLDNNVGFAVQGGFDYKLEGNWFLNFDVKKIWLSSDASVNLLGVNRVTAKVDIDPLIIGAGIGYRFGHDYVPLK